MDEGTLEPPSSPEYQISHPDPHRNSYLSGKTIEPVQIRRGMSVEELVELYSGTGYNARRLAEACELYERMIKEGATICLTLSGAMTPVGMGGVIVSLMEAGFIDWMVSTGANLYHDLHRPFNFPVVQGHFAVDDSELHRAGVARIYDVFIPEEGTLTATDWVIQEGILRRSLPERFSTADIHHNLGREVARKAPHPEKSVLAAAARLDVPIYVPAHADSSIGMNLALKYALGSPLEPSPSLDILESCAIVAGSEKNGAVEVGGGTPKNFFMQTQPMLWQFLKKNKGGHDYFIQLTDARPDTGGLSGATPSEAKSWGKLKDPKKNNVVVYGDATISLPILAVWVLSRCPPRKPRRLYRTKGELTEALVRDFLGRSRKGGESRQNKQAGK
ncbi:MAG: deoxyhypusine synthase [Thermoplasmata archaeon]